MPFSIAPTPSDAPVGQQKKGAPDQVSAIPFARSSKWHTEQANTVSGVVINSGTPGTFNFTIPSYGYLSAVFLTLVATGGTGTAAVYYEDAPWSIINNITLSDVNGVPIFQLPGYSAYLAAKFGGYRVWNPDISTALYGSTTSLTTGAGLGAIGNTPLFLKGTSGNFVAILPIFLEFGRDGLGKLQTAEDKAAVSVKLHTVDNTEGTRTYGRDSVTTTRGYAAQLAA